MCVCLFVLSFIFLFLSFCFFLFCFFLFLSVSFCLSYFMFLSFFVVFFLSSSFFFFPILLWVLPLWLRSSSSELSSISTSITIGLPFITQPCILGTQPPIQRLNLCPVFALILVPHRLPTSWLRFAFYLFEALVYDHSMEYVKRPSLFRQQSCTLVNTSPAYTCFWVVASIQYIENCVITQHGAS